MVKVPGQMNIDAPLITYRENIFKEVVQTINAMFKKNGETIKIADKMNGQTITDAQAIGFKEKKSREVVQTINVIKILNGSITKTARMREKSARMVSVSLAVKMNVPQSVRKDAMMIQVTKSVATGTTTPALNGPPLITAAKTPVLAPLTETIFAPAGVFAPLKIIPATPDAIPAEMASVMLNVVRILQTAPRIAVIRN